MLTKGRPFPLTLVGAGQVAVNRIIPALNSESASKQFQLRNVIDVVSEQEFRVRANGLLSDETLYHQAPMNCGDFGRFLRTRGLSRSPLIVASPSPLHGTHLIGSIREGCPTAIEKPLASTAEALELVDLCTHNGANPLVFPFGYYLLEKALPLLALARSGCLTPVQMSLLSNADPQQWRNARAALGKLLSFKALIQEGPDDRIWPRNPAAGGHCLETLSHLFALAVCWSRGLKVTNLLLAQTEAAADWPSENVMLATLYDEGGTEFVLGCHKSTHPSRTQRWVRLEFERGQANMDMDMQVLHLRGGNLMGPTSLTTQTKYLPQLLMFAEKILKPSTPTEYAACSRSVALTLAALSSSRKIPLRRCGETWLEEQFQ